MMQDGTPSEGNSPEELMSEGTEGPDLDPASGFLLGQLFELVQGNEAGDALACPGCGMAWPQFRETNKLGCARCYQIFRVQIRPLLERFQIRASHIGRLPGDSGQQDSRRMETVRLRIALEEAVSREDFEEAARLRDRLRQGSETDEPDDRESET